MWWQHCAGDSAVASAAEVQRGKGRVPVADYSLTAQALPDYAEISPQTAMHAATTHTPTSSSQPLQNEEDQNSAQHYHALQGDSTSPHGGSSGESQPLPSSSSASSHGMPGQAVPCSDARHQDRRNSGGAASSSGGSGSGADRGLRGRQPGTGQGAGGQSGEGRGVYSFCMCPGGQIVPTTTTPDELCINGMSFR